MIKDYKPMKLIVITSWLLTLLASFLAIPLGYFGETFLRLIGGILGIYLISWILAFLSTIFTKKEHRGESRKAVLAYTMIIVSIMSMMGSIFGGK
ncbi:hypothetical protein COY15_01660 [Candidatus Roizmanbacteria bacterium CG_4_10_14_0_2_um_filter_39_12]|nr:MAG: hypothetical protein COY15_01660 [Candidatus Roizmanbacteria bacterium CG_4_10_14_0_2_um_filter_39_12]